MPTGSLPKSGKKLFEEIYNTALKGACKGDKSCAAASAWTGVKNAGWSKDKDGKWHKKSDVKEFSLAIIKASQDPITGEKRWRAVASDTETDSCNDNMTIELFSDFTQKIEDEELPPEEFRSEFWKGGMPYLSISHYPGLNGNGVPGIVETVYVDGNRFKAKGKFVDNELGNICFETIKADLADKNKKDKVRISIAFLDYAHKHKSNGYIFERDDLDSICPECVKEYITGKKSGKYFLKGHLIHLALTRVPVNKRTSMEVERAMTTRKEDAASIVGEELAEKIDKEAVLMGKSEAMVIKADDEDQELEAKLIKDAKKEKSVLKDPKMSEDDEIIETGIVTDDGELIPDKVNTERMYNEELVEVRPYGGATSMKEAEKFSDAQEEKWRLEDLWHIFKMVIENINLDDAVEDKDKAISMVLDELKTLLASKAMVSLSYAEKAEPEHPLDNAYSMFKSEYDKIIVSEGSSDEKLMQLQEGFNVLGKTVKDTIMAKNENLPEVEQKPENSALVQLSSKVDSLTESVRLLTQIVTQNAAEKSRVVPMQRSIQPTLEMQKDIRQQELPSKKSETPSLRRLIEMTT